MQKDRPGKGTDKSMSSRGLVESLLNSDLLRLLKPVLYQMIAETLRTIADELDGQSFDEKSA